MIESELKMSNNILYCTVMFSI